MAVTTADTLLPVAPPQMTGERLFQPVRLGRYNLRHRMVMAPITRSRARQPGNVPSPLNACYGGAKGYTDYPTLAQERGEQPRPCVDERWR